MRMKIFLYYLLLTGIAPLQYCQAQKVNKNCNRAVKLQEYKKDLIKEVCIPGGYEISMLRTDLRDIDINGDGLGDFIFDWNRPKLKDGDTLFLTVYKMNKDSSYSFLKTFKNLYPLHFESYDDGPKEQKYRKIYEDCYSYGYPLKYLDLNSGTISLTLKIDDGSGYFLKYQYDNKKQNWYLIKKQNWIDTTDEVTYPDGRKYIELELPKKSESIDDFSYEKYLCPDLLNDY